MITNAQPPPSQHPPARTQEPTVTQHPDLYRYVIGRDGVFATLYDRQEQRLIVENATEEHCRAVRDRLTAPAVAEESNR